MAQRIQTRPGDALTPERFRPAASPDGAVLTQRTNVIDTFVAPSVKKNPYAGQAAAELSRALSGIAPSLARYAVQHSGEVNEDRFKEGQARAQEIRAAGMTFKQAVDRGMIKPSDSPFFRAGAQEILGEATAHDFAQAWQREVDADPVLREATDMRSYEQKLAAFRTSWMESAVGADARDEHFNSSFGRTSEALLTSHRGQFSQKAGARLEEVTKDRHIIATKGALRADLANGVETTDIATALNQKIADLRLHGHQAQTLARGTAEAALSLAQEMVAEGHEEDALEIAAILNRLTVDGQSIRDYDTKLGAAIAGLPDAINSAALQRAETAKKVRKAAWEDRVDDARVAVAQDVMNNGGRGVQQILASIADVPDAPETLARTISAIQSTQDNPAARLKMQQQIWTGSGVSVETVFKTPGLGPNDVAFLVNQVQERDGKALAALQRMNALEEREDRREQRTIRRAEEASRRQERLITEPSFRVSYSSIPRRIDDMFADLDPTKRADLVAEAQALAAMAWFDYRSGEGADKGTTDHIKKGQEIVTTLVEAKRAELGAALGGTGAKSESTGTKPKTPKKRELQPIDFATYANSKTVTPSAAAILRKYGVKPDRASIEAFYAQQARANP